MENRYFGVEKYIWTDRQKYLEYLKIGHFRVFSLKNCIKNKQTNQKQQI